MAHIKQVLYLALLLKIIYSASVKERTHSDSDDFRECHNKSKEAENMSSITTNICTSLNSKLEKNKCCRITVNYDALKRLKMNYPKDWKKKASELKVIGFDENLSEEKIKEKYVKKQSLCTLMTSDEDSNNFSLYGFSTFGIDGKTIYDCGNGEKTFNGKKYTPKKQKYKLLKDNLECRFQMTESNCYKSASKFKSNDMLACWNKVNKYDKNNGNPDREVCEGYQLSKYKTEFTKKFKEYLKRTAKIEETWNCVDKSGKKIKIYMNTFTGKFSFN